MSEPFYLRDNLAMKTLIPLSIVIVLLFAGCSKGDLKETTYSNGQLKERWYEKHLTPEKIVKVGTYESWYSDGKREREVIQSS